MSGFIIAAPSSGSGKTTITLGLLRALFRNGVDVVSGKAGPDFIDPQFHSIASGSSCFNFDPWGMRDDFLRQQAFDLISNESKGAAEKTLIIEAMMGLFDGAADGTGSAADLAALLDLPIVLVVDCSKFSHSVAAIVHGFKSFRQDIDIAGVILNKVGSDRHEMMLRSALAPTSTLVLGAVHRKDTLSLPERHLGLVQAGEHIQLDAFIENAADVIADQLDLEQLSLLGISKHAASLSKPIAKLPPLGQRISIAKDVAFSFIYPHILDGWRSQGAEISFFSPLGDQAPDKDCDAVYLPGGYPELHAGDIASSPSFMVGLQTAIDQSKTVYGECGGYMVLGEGLIDADGVRHQMVGALPLETSFANRKRHLGYRTLKPLSSSLWAQDLKAHEFHYSMETYRGDVAPLFEAFDAQDNALGQFGMCRGKTAGSYMHVIDQVN
jgi:cobyrinic acid a,c-diamide synthase